MEGLGFLLFIALVVALVYLAQRSTWQPPRATDLRAQLQSVPNMSGGEFERFMANVYTALGYDVKILGGSGDQGVDLLLHTGRESVAVQCKNHKRRVGNPPIQQVFAGQRHYRTNQAWVVAPAGFTKGAFDLARTTGVRLFDYGSIKQWIQQVEQQIEEQRANEQRANEQRANEQRARKRQAERRTEVQQVKERRTEEQQAPAEVTKPQDRSAEGVEKQDGGRISPSPGETGKGTIRISVSSSRKNAPEIHDLVVGSTATMASGDRLTVHAYESPAPPLSYWQPDEGYEFSAIDIEWCASLDSEGKPPKVTPFNFSLHMPDNTRLQWQGTVIKQPKLPSTSLGPGDCVRGWITFQKPKGVEPKFVIFSKGTKVVKWAVP